MNEVRLSLEKSIFDQFGPKLAIVGIVPATEDNPQGVFIRRDPNDPDDVDISDRIPTPPLDRIFLTTLLDLGLSLAGYPSVVDADLNAVPSIHRFRFALTMDVMTLQLIVDRWGEADQKMGPDNEQDLGQLYASILKSLAAKKDELQTRFAEGTSRSRIISIPGRSSRCFRGADA